MPDLKTLMEREVERRGEATDPYVRLLSRARRRQRNRRVASIIVGLALTAGTASGLWAVLASPSPRAGNPQPTPTVNGTPGPVAALGRHRNGMAVGFGALWLVTDDCTDALVTGGLCTGSLIRIDLGTGKVIATIPVRSPTQVSVGEGAVWVTNFLPSGVTQIDPARNVAVRTVPLSLPFKVLGNTDFLPENVVVGFGSVWVDTDRGVVARIPTDPSIDRVAAWITLLPKEPGSMAVGQGSVWVSQGEGGIARIQPGASNRVSAIISPPVRRGYSGQFVAYRDVAVGGGFIWAVGTWELPSGRSTGFNALVKIDPRTNRVVATQTLEGAVDAQGARVWFTNGRVVVTTGQAVGQYGASTLQPVSAFQLLPSGSIVAVADGAAWAVSLAGKVTRIPIGP
jgi:hypothetical protein